MAELQPGNGYAPQLRFIARGRGGVIDQDELAKASSAVDLANWPGPVLAFHQGELSRDALQAAAAQGNDKIRSDQACELAFYLREYALLDGLRDAAAPLIRQAADQCPPGFLEGIAALGESRRLAP